VKSVVLAFGLFALFAVPVLLPMLAILRDPSGWSAWREFERLTDLATNSLVLAGITTVIALPTGFIVAITTGRGIVWGGSSVRALLTMALFVPLPVTAVAWQVVLGSWLPSWALSPGEVAWRPWQLGLLPAGFVHGMAALPWVVWIISAVVRRTDHILEDDARVLGGSMAVFRLVILPRAALATLAAALWVMLQTATEIPITDAFMVRTFAEEVYTQLVGGGAALSHAVAVAVPVWAAALLTGWLFARRLSKRTSPLSAELTPARDLESPRSLRWIATSFAWLVVAVSTGVPLAALVWRAAGGGVSKLGAHPEMLIDQLEKVIRTDGTTLITSLAAAVATGVVTAGIALVACQLARHSRWFAGFLIALSITLALTPGPLVGLGLKEAIRLLLDLEDAILSAFHLQPAFPLLRSALYDQPSPIPAGWAAAIRLFPVACLLLWPAIRAIPQELYELARLDGHGSIGVWRLVVFPSIGTVALRAVLAIAALALGEVSAGKLVNPPFRDVYILRLFDQMHYGAEPTVAALCLLQIAMTGLLATGVLLANRTGRVYSLVTT